jgi:hypothetical protein
VKNRLFYIENLRGEEVTLRKYVKFSLLFLLAILIIWFFGRNLDWAEVNRSLRKANVYYLALAVVIISFGYWLRAKRWQVLLSPITESSMKELFATTTVGFAAVFLVGRMGEIVRPMWLPMRDKRVRASAALVTLMVERILDFASLISFFAFNLIWFTPPPGREQDFAFVETTGWIIFAIIFSSIGLLVVYAKVSKQFILMAEKVLQIRFVPKKLARVTMSLLRQLASALNILHDKKQSMLAIFWTLALWFSIALPTWLVLMAFQLPLTLTDALFIMGFAAFSSVIPTPGGAAGAFHTATAGSLIFLGIGREESAAVAIVMHLVYFAPALIFGFYYFLHGDLSLSGFRQMLDLSEHPVEQAVSEISDDTNNGEQEEKTILQYSVE